MRKARRKPGLLFLRPISARTGSREVSSRVLHATLSRSCVEDLWHIGKINRLPIFRTSPTTVPMTELWLTMVLRAQGGAAIFVAGAAGSFGRASPFPSAPSSPPVRKPPTPTGVASTRITRSAGFASIAGSDPIGSHLATSRARRKAGPIALLGGTVNRETGGACRARRYDFGHADMGCCDHKPPGQRFAGSFVPQPNQTGRHQSAVCRCRWRSTCHSCLDCRGAECRALRAGCRNNNNVIRCLSGSERRCERSPIRTSDGMPMPIYRNVNF